MGYLSRMRSMKKKIFILLVLTTALYFTLFYFLISMWNVNNEILKVVTVNLNYVVVHLDLKGSPPKLDYLKTLLPMLRTLGVNGLLIEYEDMFPYENKLFSLSAKNCYNRNELKEFLAFASNKGFEIIPLIQTYGHMEHVLKIPQFKHLREEALHPDSICPSKSESQELVKHMLEQVIHFHKNISPLKYFHIGCDEVYHINKCEQCVKRGLSNIDIYLEHVKAVTDIMKSLSPTTTVLFWDDMLREIKLPQWEDIEVPSDIEPVYWDYEPSLRVSHVNLLKYHHKFNNIWISSAFKGADGRAATFPDWKKRFLNHFSWMNMIYKYKFGGEKSEYDFKGIILTGWSRYSHMDPPCELLPASLPSLVINLLLINKFRSGLSSNDNTNGDINNFFTHYLSEDLNKMLHCDLNINFDYFDSSFCYFNESELTYILKQLELVNGNIVKEINDVKRGLFNLAYYAKLKKINMNVAHHNMIWCNDTLTELMELENTLRETLEQYYDEYFIAEYVSYKTFSSKQLLKNIIKQYHTSKDS